jgi:hypothetical protein
MKLLVTFTIFFLPLLGQGQSVRVPRTVEQVSLGDKSSNIYEVRGNVYITYNIQMTCVSDCASDQLPFAEVHRYYPNAVVHVNYSTQYPATKDGANFQTVAGITNSIYLPAAFLLPDTGSPNTIGVLGSAAYGTSAFQSGLYGIFTAGDLSTSLALQEEATAELQNSNTGQPLPLSSYFLIGTGPDPTAASLGDPKNSSLLPASSYDPVNEMSGIGGISGQKSPRLTNIIGAYDPFSTDMLFTEAKWPEWPSARVTDSLVSVPYNDQAINVWPQKTSSFETISAIFNQSSTTTQWLLPSNSNLFEPFKPPQSPSKDLGSQQTN